MNDGTIINPATLDARYIRHAPLSIKNSGAQYVEIPEGSKILTVKWDGEYLALCVEVYPLGVPRQRKIWFCKDGDISEAGIYIATFLLATNPCGGSELVHVFIEI